MATRSLVHEAIDRTVSGSSGFVLFSGFVDRTPVASEYVHLPGSSCESVGR
jgi:hypothetical protein